MSELEEEVAGERWFVEGQNLATRNMLRFTRLTDSFSKKVTIHAHAVGQRGEP
jgi:hypothetical protein